MSDTKQERKAIAEALQVASTIRKSGYDVFCSKLNECSADLDIFEKCLSAMNKEADGKKRLGNTENISKLLVSPFISTKDENHRLLATAYVPKSQENKFTSEEFLKASVPEFLHEHIQKNDNGSFIILENDPDKNIYIFKLQDDIISKGNQFIRSKGLRQMDVDDDEECFGEEVFDAM